MTDRALLSLTHITKSFEHNKQIITVIKNVHATFVQGISYAIAGSSGSGKSTLLHLIAGLDTPDTGTIFYNTLNLHTLAPRERSLYLNKTIGLVFQSSYCIKELSVLENVMLPGIIATTDMPYIKKKALDLLAYVGLADYHSRKPRELSGGQQQRMALARALINNPLFLIADEPTGNLDTASAELILSLITQCKKEWNMGVIISSHDQGVLQKMDELYVLNNYTLSKQEKLL
jgi:lipoprotein-releasing system ATP-binding protein